MDWIQRNTKSHILRLIDVLTLTCHKAINILKQFIFIPFGRENERERESKQENTSTIYQFTPQTSAKAAAGPGGRQELRMQPRPANKC